MVDVLSSASSTNLGAFLVDVTMHDHFLETNPKLKLEEIPRNLQRSQHLLAGCNKLKHVCTCSQCYRRGLLGLRTWAGTTLM